MLDSGSIVYVVDDDISVRESLEMMIDYEGWRPQLFATAEQFLACPRARVPSCLILDLNLPNLDGLALQKLLSSDRTIMPIIFITGYGDVPTTVKAMKAGAAEFLTKPFSEDVLLGAIRNALQRSLVALGREAEVQGLYDCYSTLTPREQEVMTRVVSGMLNKQVGDDLGISEITVKAHRGKAMSKMKAASLPDLVNMAAKLHIPRASGAGPQRTK